MKSKADQKLVITPLGDILAEDDIKQLMDKFLQEDMANARKLIILWENRKGVVSLRTNYPYVTCGHIFRMAYEAIEK